MMAKKIILNLYVVSLLMQAGASLFAYFVVGSTLLKSPPESLEMLNGEFSYDSSNFWNVFPNIPTILFLIAIVLFWKTEVKSFLIISFSIFFIAGLVAIFLMGPLNDELRQGIIDNIGQWRMYETLQLILIICSGFVAMYSLNKNQS